MIKLLFILWLSILLSSKFARFSNMLIVSLTDCTSAERTVDLMIEKK